MTKRRRRRVFTPEFEAKAVGLCLTGQRSIAQVAKDLDLTETALRSRESSSESMARPWRLSWMQSESSWRTLSSKKRTSAPI